MKTFRFDDSKSQWVEEKEHLLSQDICVFLDEDKEIIYLWKGLKTSKKRFKLAYDQIKDLISHFPELNLHFMMVEENFPNHVQEKLDSMLKRAKKEKSSEMLFSRFMTIRIYFLSLLSVIILPIFCIINLSSSLLWNSTGESYNISNRDFQTWMNYSKILTSITLMFFVINLVIGIIEIENQIIVISIVGLLMCIGLIIYLNFDIYLFLFQEGSTLTNYIILKRDIMYFLLINIISISIFHIPNIFKFISFLKKYRKYIL
jgi:hypothetical protein